MSSQRTDDGLAAAETAAPSTAAAAIAEPVPQATAAAPTTDIEPGPGRVAARPASAPPPPSTARRRGPGREQPATETRRPEHRRARDYATTRLVNFRIPVDLHDRFKRILRDVEDEHPKLRHPNLTELLIGLLEEGPQSADEVAGVIRRKRAAEHAEDDS